ncbi:MAG: flagellar export chaperone FliS [Azonexaceae bacterium]|uniref:flagellar export chaperone FliS n=1 Tax=Azonexus sp. R2A61 TaxID=2744443 RepID=UPI001F3B15BA|nr:flagellar export chaperone FliS [Azonexus sp. R2A61]MCE1239366.1 flagellar export chaperone FliS [Azonexaceae bacterium]
MGFTANPIKTYQNLGIESEVRGSDPHHLIVLLFDGAIAALDKGKAAIIDKRFGDKSEALTKAVEIINDGLSASLNLQEGGELAANLKALYNYMVSRLIHANFKNDIPAIDEVKMLIGEIFDAWKSIAPGKQQTGR